jgi:para-aminobenzoate synthetase/4-amino-4-deoxychorismate lyase
MPAPLHCDPARGVFETLLILDGQPIELDAHLARLARSLEAVFTAQLPDGARQAAFEAGREIALGRLRLIASPDASRRIAVSASADPIEPEQAISASPRSVDLQTIEVRGGFGAHKWVDRALLEQAERAAPEGTAPLLLDGDGTVLEASRANVFAIRDGVLCTPPTDGRIVPGITRRRLLGLTPALGHEVREEPLALYDLLAADEVFVTNSVRGVQPVHAIDNLPLPSADVPRLDGPNADVTRGTSRDGGVGGGGATAGLAGPGGVTAELAEALRRDWLDQAARAATAAAVP